MKTGILIAEGVKQIIFTPETQDEENALNLITTNDDIELLITNGSMGENRYKPFQASAQKCRGGHLRFYEDSKSKIFVLTPKNKDTTDKNPLNQDL